MNTATPSGRTQRANTHQRLLLTALHLYATQGLHAVSLRRISVEAGSKNSAAIHYHFNNKLGVIQALIELIARELSTIDSQLREQPTAATSLRDTCRNTLLPLALLPSAQPWGADAVLFIARLLSENDPDIAAAINRVYGPFWQRLDQALATRLPELPTQVRQLRLLFMSTNVFHGVAEASGLAHSPLGDLSTIEPDILLNQLVDYLIGGLQAPSYEYTPIPPGEDTGYEPKR